MGVGGGLMIVGGLVSAIGIRDPGRRREPEPAPRAAAAGECGRATAPDGGEPVSGELSPTPAGATPEPMDSAL